MFRHSSSHGSLSPRENRNLSCEITVKADTLVSRRNVRTHLRNLRDNSASFGRARNVHEEEPSCRPELSLSVKRYSSVTTTTSRKRDGPIAETPSRASASRSGTSECSANADFFSDEYQTPRRMTMAALSLIDNVTRCHAMDDVARKALALNSAWHSSSRCASFALRAGFSLQFKRYTLPEIITVIIVIPSPRR